MEAFGPPFLMPKSKGVEKYLYRYGPSLFDPGSIQPESDGIGPVLLDPRRPFANGFHMAMGSGRLGQAV